jgi:hypothetical protein
MAENPEKTVTTWQTKLRVLVSYPSILVDTRAPKNMWEVTTISVNRSKEQRTINTVVGARKGFITVERDFTGTFTIQETDPALAALERLAASNDLFDIAIEEYTENREKSEGDQEWVFSQIAAVGCKIEDVRTRYDFAMLPMREFTFKFLRSEITDIENPDEPTTEQTGVYWDVDVSW